MNANRLLRRSSGLFSFRHLVLLVLLSNTGWTWAEPQRWDFDVYLDQRLLGSHSFIVEPVVQNTGAGQQPVQSGYKMVSRASFEVKLLFIRAYSYQHTSNELYRRGCLQELRSETVSGSERYAVSADKNEQTLQVLTETNQPGFALQQSLDDCLMSFAYWDKRMLQQDRLLNSQTGQVLPVEINALAEEAFGGVLAQPFEITGRADAEESTPTQEPSRFSKEPSQSADLLQIKVWYNKRNNQWIGLQSRLENGRMLRYVLRDPATAVQINV